MTILFAIVAFLLGAIAGASLMHECCIKANEQKDPEVHVLSRTIYWVSNIHSAYNQAMQLFDENPDKIQCISLKINDEPYCHNRFYCKYKSIGNKWLLDMTLGFEDTPHLKLVPNAQAEHDAEAT